MSLSGEIRNSLSRGLAQLIKRPIYVIMMIVVPLLCAFFLLSLMQRGSVAHVPVGIVDLDNSSLSRRLVRNMNAFQQVDVVENYLTFEKAREAVQKGEIFGFFYIPSNFEEQALGGRTPKVSYYINYAYYAPGSMQYKGFKTISLLTNGGIVQTVLRTVGLRDEAISATLQPYNVHTHMRGNPWLNYSYYLNMSFIPCLLALFVLLVTTFSIGQELKLGLSRKWLNVAGDSMPVALFGKLFPQFCVFTATGWAIQFMMFVIYGLPFNGNAWNMILAMPLF
ncbi:MAG: ABC transporter permease, partial [Muribaculaceae bacterium]|nr:ABC transporter permease [Muribaculaceae bacterium]